MAKIKNVAETAKRKRIINAKECEYELRESLEKLFDAFWNAVRNYEKEVIQTPFTARCRGFLKMTGHLESTKDLCLELMDILCFLRN